MPTSKAEHPGKEPPKPRASASASASTIRSSAGLGLGALREAWFRRAGSLLLTAGLPQPTRWEACGSLPRAQLTTQRITRCVPMQGIRQRHIQRIHLFRAAAGLDHGSKSACYPCLPARLPLRQFSHTKFNGFNVVRTQEAQTDATRTGPPQYHLRLFRRWHQSLVDAFCYPWGTTTVPSSAHVLCALEHLHFWWH